MNQIYFYWAFTPAKVAIYQSIHSSYLIWQPFYTNPAIFLPFRQVWTLGFLWRSLQHFWSVFLFDNLKWNSTLCQIHWIPDLKLLKLVCFMVANTWKQKYAISWLNLTHFKMAIFGQYKIRDDNEWKHFKYWLCSSNVLLKHWTYFPKVMLIISKTRYLLHVFYDFIQLLTNFSECFATCS